MEKTMWLVNIRGQCPRIIIILEVILRKLIVPSKFNNKKVSDFLYHNFNGLSKNTLYKAFRKKDIRINNTKIGEDLIIHTHDEITIYIIDDLLFKNINIQKIYEDENILVVNKPTNLEVVGDNSLTSLLSKEYSYISPCHRLDRNTTGLVLFSKNETSLNILLDKFKKHEIEKHYLAMVYGIPKIKSQKLTAYLFKDNKKSLVYISDTPKKGYVKIKTSYTLIEKNTKENYSILDVKLHTGKTHQIRAHLAHIGHPIIGDGKYGINEINKKFNYNTQQLNSYLLKFNFKTDAGILNYLNQKVINNNSIKA